MEGEEKRRNRAFVLMNVW